MPPRRPGPPPGPRRPARAAVAAARTTRPHRGARPRRDPAGGPSSSMRSCCRLVGSGGDGNCRRDSARRPGEPASLARGGAGSRDAGAGRRVRPGSDARSPFRRRGGQRVRPAALGASRSRCRAGAAGSRYRACVRVAEAARGS